MSALSWRLARIKPGKVGTTQHWYRADRMEKFRGWKEVARDVFYRDTDAQVWFSRVIDRHEGPASEEYVVEER